MCTGLLTRFRINCIIHSVVTKERTIPVTLQELARLKAKNATLEQCKYAIADCHVTLKVMGLEHNHIYSQKLWAEIDAYRDQMMKLNSKGKDQNQ